ncbi:MAG: polymer-forming cytoskeletal protein [Candidatus Omnitrophota bacterium]
MRKRNEEKQRIEEKVLDVNAAMQGTLRFEDPVNLRINGRFEGTLDTKGMLMVGQQADIKANITGESVSVAGNVNGNITATKLLKLDSTACINGDIAVPRLSIQEGAVLNGRVKMKQSASGEQTPRGSWMTLNQVAEYLEVDANKVHEWANSGVLPGTRESGEWIFEKEKIEQWISQGKVRA